MADEPDDRQEEAASAADATAEDRIERKIDRDLRDSFPASDPPGWVLGVRRPSEKEEEAGGPSNTAADDESGE